MVAYNGKHGYKQFIKSKPIRFGLKIFVSIHLSDISLHLKRIRARHTEEKTTPNLEKEDDVF